MWKIPKVTRLSLALWSTSRGTSNLGLDFSGRSWFQKVKTDQKPYVSEVFVGQLAVLSPIVNVCVPVMRENHWFGSSTGTLDLTRVQEMLQSYRFNRVTDHNVD